MLTDGLGATMLALHEVLCTDPTHGGQRLTCVDLHRDAATAVVTAPTYGIAVDVVHEAMRCPPPPVRCDEREHLAALSATRGMRLLWMLAGHDDPHEPGATS